MVGTPKPRLTRIINYSFTLLFITNLLFIGNLLLSILGKGYSFFISLILFITVIIEILGVTLFTTMEMIELKSNNKKETDLSWYEQLSKVSFLLFNGILTGISIVLSILVFIYAKTIPTLLLDASCLLIIYNTIFQLLLLPIEIREIKGKLYGIN